LKKTVKFSMSDVSDVIVEDKCCVCNIEFPLGDNESEIMSNTGQLYCSSDCYQIWSQKALQCFSKSGSSQRSTESFTSTPRLNTGTFTSTQRSIESLTSAPPSTGGADNDPLSVPICGKCDGKIITGTATFDPSGGGIVHLNMSTPSQTKATIRVPKMFLTLMFDPYSDSNVNDNSDANDEIDEKSDISDEPRRFK
jgi:hypothetical protein